MAQVTSGRVLRETRERKGYDLTTVARRLRIRPDILRAIEANDFSSMPPRGYTRNMINAYARLLGLNPTEIVNMFLDESYAHQVQKARSAAPSAGFDMGRDRRRSRSERRQEVAYDEEEGFGAQQSPSKRKLYDDRTRYSRDDYGIQRERVRRTDRSSRDFMSHHSDYPQSDYGIYNDDRQARRHRQVHVGHTPMEYSAPRLPGGLMGRLPLIIAAVAVVVLIIILIVFVFNGGNGGGTDDVSQLPVSGINDTTGTGDDAEADEPPVEVAPTSARITYSVGEGNEVYIETYDNSETPKAEMLTGPVEQTLETTGVWTITTFTPDLITVMVNGEQVKLEPNQEYGGMSTYTVDFPKMLEEWRQTHSSKSSQRQAAVASAANAASADATKSSGASAATGNTGTGADTATQGTTTSGTL